MKLLQRPFTVLLAAALLSVSAAQVATAAPASVEPLQAAAKPNASVVVQRCRSHAYYSARELKFRTKMLRTSPGAGERLEIKVELWRKVDEGNHFRRVKLSGLSEPTYGQVETATVYQRDVTIKNPETAARYKLRAVFRWIDPDSGKAMYRRTIWSKPCKQRVGLPKLSITGVQSIPVAGSKLTTNTVTVANTGKSEAVDVPVALYTDTAGAVVQKIDSIGPGQTADIALSVPACQVSAYAQIDPLVTLVRLKGATRAAFPIANCR